MSETYTNGHEYFKDNAKNAVMQVYRGETLETENKPQQGRRGPQEMVKVSAELLDNLVNLAGHVILLGDAVRPVACVTRDRGAGASRGPADARAQGRTRRFEPETDSQGRCRGNSAPEGVKE